MPIDSRVKLSTIMRDENLRPLLNASCTEMERPPLIRLLDRRHDIAAHVADAMLRAKSTVFSPASDSEDADDLLVGETTLAMVPFLRKAAACKIRHFRWTTFLWSGHVRCCSAT
jgi:hypothetical protein